MQALLPDLKTELTEEQQAREDELLLTIRDYFIEAENDRSKENKRKIDAFSYFFRR